MSNSFQELYLGGGGVSLAPPLDARNVKDSYIDVGGGRNKYPPPIKINNPDNTINVDSPKNLLCVSSVSGGGGCGSPVTNPVIDNIIKSTKNVSQNIQFDLISWIKDNVILSLVVVGGLIWIIKK